MPAPAVTSPASTSPASTSLPSSGPSRSPVRYILWLLIAIGLVAITVWLYRHRSAFNLQSLLAQMSAVSWARVALGFACIYVAYWLRAMRWAVLLTPIHRASTLQLLPAQLIGFTAVGLFGRFADLGRPCIIARRTGTAVTTQLAIYSVERAFDLGAAAILFSVALAFAPANLPHHQAFVRAGLASLAVTLAVAVLAAALRLRGQAVARLAGKLLAPVSPAFAAAAEARILDLRHGFQTLATFQEFATALAISLGMWALIAGSYLLSAHAFRASPPLATFTFTATMLLLATGIGGSVLQLPVLGWFTQIALIGAALHGFFAVPIETATACSTIILLVTNLSVIPLGLIAARLQGTTLRAASESRDQVVASK